MICYGFKGGIGTASRKLEQDAGGYTVGVLVQANFGRRDQLLVAGAPVGRDMSCEQFPCRAAASRPEARDGSIIIVVATDAPLLAHQLKRIARRAALGLARTGTASGNGSGDIFIAFSTANEGAAKTQNSGSVTMLANSRMDPLFEATVQATEEAIINALVAAETNLSGRDDHRIVALPHEPLRQALKRYGRLQ